jgi:hypothetical protein
MLVLAVSSAVAALLLLTASARGYVAGDEGAAAPVGVEYALLGIAPEGGGALLMAFERWVVDAIAGAVAVVVRATAWVLGKLDAEVIGRPLTAVAARAVRIGHAVEPRVGGSLARVAWAVVGAVAFGSLLHALWPAR